MKKVPNYLVKFNDEENEKKQESMFFNDQVNAEDEIKNDEQDGEEKNKQKECQQNLIIYPKSWLTLWNYMIHACLFYGFFRDPQYLAFHVSNKEGI